MNGVSRLLALIMLAVLTALMPAASANTVAGCNSPADLHVSTWGKTINVTSFVPPGTEKPIPDDVDKPAPEEFPQTEYRLAASAEYWHCPNGTARNKIKFKRFNLCATLMDQYPSELLVALVFRGHTHDDLFPVWSSGTNSIPMRAVDDRGEYRCETIHIADENERWQWKADTPRWAMSGVVNLNVLNNPVFNFKAGGDRWRNVDPGGADPELTVLH